MTLLALLTTSRANKRQARNTGATRDMDGQPFAKIAKSDMSSKRHGVDNSLS